MNRRLALRFVGQLAVAGIAVLLATAVIVWIVIGKLDKARFAQDFAQSGLTQLVESSELLADGRIHFAPELLKQVEQNGGWLQTLDDTGKVETSYRTPADVPEAYATGELVDYWMGRTAFPYRLYLWMEFKHGRMYTIVYGTPYLGIQALTELQQLQTASQDDLTNLHLPMQLRVQLDKEQAYLQLLDADGKEQFAYGKPADVPDYFTPQDLALRTMYSERYGYEITSRHDPSSEMTWLIGIPYGGQGAGARDALQAKQTKIVLAGLLSLLLVLFLLFVAQSLWQARRFGMPMLHMLSWMEQLSKANYEEPQDRRGLPRSRTVNGRWRRRYRVFAQMIDSLHTLSQSLAADTRRRAQTEQLRDEWIAGVTHDLKTPLSSINGYAHLLAESSYTWSSDEVQRFSSVMLEKTSHMEALISDLELTYRLKSGLTPPDWQEIEWKSWLADVLHQIARHPEFQQRTIHLRTTDDHSRAHEGVYREIYPPWLERVIMNLTANALLHNPPNTVLTVTLEVPSSSTGRLALIFEDDGNGMDEDTQERLFERYYRGTDTASASHGTGLGMAIARGLVEAMGGSIHVTSTLGQGTCIRLEWSAPADSSA